MEAQIDNKRNIFFSMKIEHILFIDSASYLHVPFRKLPEAFGPSVTQSLYPNYFNSKESLDYVGPFPHMSYFAANEMSQHEKREFITWHDGK